MERNFARLYNLENKPWKPLADLINNPLDISIYQLMNFHSKGEAYAIISMTKNADENIEQYGGIEIKMPNTLRECLKEDNRPLYGDTININYL